MKFIVWTTFGGTTTPILANNVVTRQSGPGMPGRYSIMSPQTDDGEPFQITFGDKLYKVSGVLSVPENMVGMYAEVEEIEKPGDPDEVLKHSKIDEGRAAEVLKEAQAARKKPEKRKATRKRSVTAKPKTSTRGDAKNETAKNPKAK